MWLKSVAHDKPYVRINVDFLARDDKLLILGHVRLTDARASALLTGD